MSPEPFKLGLTGSIASGKSTTAGFFREAGIPVWDADAAVHDLYAMGGAGVPEVAKLVPDAVSGGAVDRDKLRETVLDDPAILRKLEAAIHPLVAKGRAGFLGAQRKAGAGLVVFDIPLLFETGAQEWLDGVLVVTAEPEILRNRALSRPGMTEQSLAAILSRQMPPHEKTRRADFTIDTSTGLEDVRNAVVSLIRKIRAGNHA